MLGRSARADAFEAGRCWMRLASVRLAARLGLLAIDWLSALLHTRRTAELRRDSQLKNEDFQLIAKFEIQ